MLRLRPQVEPPALCSASPRLAALLLCCGLLPPLFGGCGGGRDIAFNYPGEKIDFSAAPQAPSVYLGLIRDLRPEAQREGRGRFLGINYPSDRQWQWPVTQVYREALVQDLSGTSLVELVPLPSQADYTLTADILSFGSRIARSPVALLLPMAIGGGVGMAFGEDSSDRIKTGAVMGLAALLALPLPTPHRSEVEVKLTLTDGQGEVVWERSCLGVVEDRVGLTAVARDDQKLTDRHLTRALKRANACLLGQLRQALVPGDGAAAP